MVVKFILFCCDKIWCRLGAVSLWMWEHNSGNGLLQISLILHLTFCWHLLCVCFLYGISAVNLFKQPLFVYEIENRIRIMNKLYYEDIFPSYITQL